MKSLNFRTVPATFSLNVRCNECRASLEAAEFTRYLTCAFCGSELFVHRTSTSVFTEKIEGTAGNLEGRRIQNEITQLDRIWDAEKGNYLVRFKRGYHEPNGVDYFIWSIFAALGFMSILSAATSPRGDWGSLLFGIVLASAGGWRLYDCVQKRSRLDTRFAAYQSRRQQLEEEFYRLGSAENGAG